MLKPMHLDFSMMHIAKHILMLPGIAPDAVLVETVVFGDTVVQVKREDGLVQPFQLVNPVARMVGWQRPVVLEPGQLGSVHEVTDNDSVPLRRVSGASVHDGGCEPEEAVHKLLFGAASKQIVVPSNKHDIDRSGVGFADIV